MKTLALKCCDFQVHSPRDQRYREWPESLMTLEGLRAWAAQLLKECESRGVDCVAVTDHHDLIPGLVLMSVAYENKSPIWVLPGMEVTSKSGLQAILLLDPSLFGNPDSFDLTTTEGVANKILAALGQDISAHAGAKNLMLASWKQLSGLKDLEESKRRAVFVSPPSDRVDKDFDGQDGIAYDLERSFSDRYVLLPNLEKNRHGVFGNENGRALYLKAEGWFVGGVVGGGNPTNEPALQGKDGGYGNRVVSCLRTSDQRGQDATNWFGDRLGHADCVTWLKISEPTTISITQALISGETRRVFRSGPNEPGDRLEELTIVGAEVFGLAPIKFHFSPYLTTLIGGRGSGKSLTLSALVRIFGIDKEWSASEDSSIWEKRHLSLFTAGGPFSSPDVHLAVEYRKESGVRYKLSIESPGEPLMEERHLDMWTGADWTRVADGEAVLAAVDFRPLFFLQGQMSSMTGSRLDQHDLIRLIEGPIRSLRQGLRRQLQQLAEKVRDGFQLKRQKHQLDTRIKQSTAQIKQKEEERKAFLEAAKKGLDPEQQALFDQAEIYRRSKAAAQRVEEQFSEAIATLGNIVNDLDRATAGPVLESITKLQSASDKFSRDAYLVTLIDSVSSFRKELDTLRDNAQRNLGLLSQQKEPFVANINALIAKAQEFGEKERARKEGMVRAAQLEKEIADLSKQTAANELELQKIERTGKIALGEASLAEFKKVVKEYSNRFKERADAISANPEFRLVVRVIPGGLYQDFMQQLKAICQGCGIREKTWSELEVSLEASGDAASKITDLIASAIAAFDDPERPAVPTVWRECGFSDAVFKNILSKTQIEHWLELSAVLAEDKVDVRYKKGGGKAPIPILSASPGERAVELLKLALYSTKGPLMIDQPEDDLDNHFLAEKLVDLVHQSKLSNQLIFSSHNANLVVHGDAELIHVMTVAEVGGGKIGAGLKSSGTIDQKDICLAVERVMEGGRPAFEQRRRKYHETVDPLRVIEPETE